MDITYLGHASFRLKGKNATVVTDPYDGAVVGLKFPKNTAADIVTVSHDHPDHNAVKAVEGTPFVISGPGEYEVNGVGVMGFPSFHDADKGNERGRNTMYKIDIDGVRIVHLGDLGHILSSADVDLLDTVDVLFVPVGGFYTIDATVAAQLISDIEPSIVIPMHYGRPELPAKTFGELAPVSTFLKSIGKPDVMPVSKLAVVKDKLPTEMQVVVFE